MNDTTYMTNAAGHLVPEAKVRPEDRLEDTLVRDLYMRASNLNKLLASFKATTFSEVDAFRELLLEKYQASKGGKKGNVSLLSYDGLTKVMISVADFITFGPQLQVAKSLIDECIREWASSSNDNIKALIDHAFRVDKQNRINTQAVLQLRTLNINHPTWQKAMEAITDSLRVVSSKQYVRFYQRESIEADWKAVPLDIANV